MRESEKQMREAIRCLYLEVPEPICREIEAKFEAYREDMVKDLNNNYYTEELDENNKVHKKEYCETTRGQ